VDPEDLKDAEDMKTLTIGECVFQLPDDFEGFLPDALRLMADYLEKPKEQIHEANLCEGKAVSNELWADFLTVIGKGGLCAGSFKLARWDGEDWQELKIRPFGPGSEVK